MERSTHTLAVKSQKWIVQALLTLIQKKPYEEITISEICIKAGLDRRTFYRNFKDKNDVLQFYFSDLQKEYKFALKTMPEHTFYTLALTFFEFWTFHLDFFKTTQNNQALNAALFQALNTVIPAIYATAGCGISNKLQFNIAFIVGGFHNSLIAWINTGFHESAEEMATIVSVMFKDNIPYWPAL